MGVVALFLRRILRYNLPLSAVGTLLGLLSNPFQNGKSAHTVVVVFGERFIAVACSIGFAVSIFAYWRLHRRELAIYHVRGFHLTQVAAVAFVVLLAGLSAILAFIALLLAWMGL
jgi:hypothetical protein